MHTWIRSGKACGIDANFISRLHQHATGASAGGSYFYDCYPSSALPVRALLAWVGEVRGRLQRVYRCEGDESGQCDECGQSMSL